MPRAKDAPTVTGGMIDPYVERTLARRGEAAENRLLTAMQGASAMARQRLAGEQAMEQERLRGEQALHQQAVAAALEDRRAAAAEAARRDEMAYRRVNDEANRMLEKQLADSQLKFQKAQMANNLAEAEKARKMAMDLERIKVYRDIRLGEQQRNATLTMIKMAARQETSRQTILTEFIDSEQRVDQALGVHDRTKINVVRNLRDDPELAVIPGRRPEPFSALQKQFTLEGSKVKADELMPENVHMLKDKIRKREIDAEDLRTAWSVLDGMEDTLDEKIKDAVSGNDRAMEHFWKWTRLRISNMKTGLSTLTTNEEQVEGEERTVGFVARTGLGPILGTDTGNQVKRARENGIDYTNMLEAFSGAMEPYERYDVPGIETKEVRSFLDDLNIMLMGMQEKEMKPTGDQNRGRFWRIPPAGGQVGGI
jgi:hypothetical protein